MYYKFLLCLRPNWICLHALQPYWENRINGNSSLGLLIKESGKGGWEWPEGYEKEEMSAQIKGSPREDYKFSEKQINSDVNYAAANVTICILKTFFPYHFTTPRASRTLSAIDKSPPRGWYFNVKSRSCGYHHIFQYTTARNTSLPSPPWLAQ